jgi:AraC-like DNA-binding protein
MPHDGLTSEAACSRLLESIIGSDPTSARIRTTFEGTERLIMRTRTRDFPGADRETSERLAFDVARDEKAIINEILELRREKPMSLEAIGFLLGADPSQISRYLNRTSGVTLTNYLRIARALGYRRRIALEAADESPGDTPLPDLRIAFHKVCNARRPRTE